MLFARKQGVPFRDIATTLGVSLRTAYRIAAQRPAPDRASTYLRTTDDGDTERYCGRCHEWWPATFDYFHRAGMRFQTWCKACFLEYQRERPHRPTVRRARATSRVYGQAAPGA